MLLIPAVDVLGAEAVRLVRGDFDRVVVRADPVELARRFGAAGARLVHVVDLDGARAGRVRPDLVRLMVEAAAPAAIQFSGGIRSPADADAVLEAGAVRVVVGTAAFTSDLAAYAGLGERLVVALDVRGGMVAVRGWLSSTALGAAEAVERCREAGVQRLLCSAIERDGTLAGPDLALVERVVGLSGLPVLAAGGVRSTADLEALERAGAEGAIVGRAFLDEAQRLSPALLARVPVSVSGTANALPRKGSRELGRQTTPLRT